MLHDSTLLYIVLAGLVVISGMLLISLLKRRAAEKRLQEQFLFLKTLIESFSNPVFYKNRDGVYVGCNEAFLTMLGRTRDEVVGKGVYDLSPPDLARRYEKADNDLFEQEGEQRYETQVQFADGSIHEMLFTKAVYRDTTGKVAGLLGVMLDITERKRAEEDVREAYDRLEERVEERTAELADANRRLAEEIRVREVAEVESREKGEFLQTVIDSITHGMVVINADDKTVALANRAAGGGRSLEGSYCYTLHHGLDTPCNMLGHDCPVDVVIGTGKDAVSQHEHVMPDGSRQYVEIHAFPVFDSQGKVVQVIESIMDITSRKEGERAMAEAKEMAETTNRLMSEFLDTVSHELRTPMTSVHGFAKLIDKTFDRHFYQLAEGDEKLGGKVERIKANLDIIISESERLTQLINKHLDLSKLQSGRVDWYVEAVAPAVLVGRAMAATTSLFDGIELEIDMVLEEGLPDIAVDPDRLIQVLINLISNAVKFTEQGSVTCGVTQEDGVIRFYVQDTGLGIPENYQEVIFSKFRQLQSNDGGKPSGTGLGLAISREIVLHHGGRIWVDSEPGKGSTFSFTIPVK